MAAPIRRKNWWPNPASRVAWRRLAARMCSSIWAAAAKASCRCGSSMCRRRKANRSSSLVVRFDADEGLYELSRPTAAVNVGNWNEVSEGQVIEVNITGANKGGLECQVAGIRGFIPMGQVSTYRVENPEEFVGQRLACVVTEANRDRRNLVLSHRAVMERERNEQRDKLMAELAPGQLREGIVRSLKDFGAFVDLGGIDGLIHISQLSWDRVKHPSEVLEVGQKVKVRIEKFDKETGKVSLSYREMGANPWQNVDSKYPVGARAKATVSRLMDFGAFVKLEPGVEGLIHISELAPWPRVSGKRRRERRAGSGSEDPLGGFRAAADQPFAQGAAGGAREAGPAASGRRRFAVAGRCAEAAAKAAPGTQGRHRQPFGRRKVRAQLVSALRVRDLAHKKGLGIAEAFSIDSGNLISVAGDRRSRPPQPIPAALTSPARELRSESVAT